MYGMGPPHSHTGPADPGYGAHYPVGEDPPTADPSVASGAGSSALMERAGDRLRKKRASPPRRPDLSSKLEAGRDVVPSAPSPGDESTFDDTRTDAESSYGTSLVSGTSSFTDTTAGERSSRRALILQMAKARMKSGRGATGGGRAEPPGAGAAAGAGNLEGVAGLELD